MDLNPYDVYLVVLTQRCLSHMAYPTFVAPRHRRVVRCWQRRPRSWPNQGGQPKDPQIEIWFLHDFFCNRSGSAYIYSYPEHLKKKTRKTRSVHHTGMVNPWFQWDSLSTAQWKQSEPSTPLKLLDLVQNGIFGGVPKIGVPQNGWFIMENPIKMGWFGGTPISGNIYLDTKLNSPKIHLSRNLPELPAWN